MKAELPVPSWEEIKDVAPRLSEWTDMAAEAYGLYDGVNKAIGAASDKSTDSARMAEQMRQQLALMAVIRCFAVLDRSSARSFQAVNRFLKATSHDQLSRLPQVALRQFRSAYEKLDVDALKRMQSFRNDAIAHVSWRDAQKFISYGELAGLVRNACDLADALNLMTSGMNDTPIEHMDGAYEQSKHFWDAVLRDDPDPFRM